MFKRNVRIVFEGAHLNGAINALSAMCLLYGVRKQGGRCSVMLPSRCFEQAVDFLRKRCYNVVETTPCGAYALGIEYGLVNWSTMLNNSPLYQKQDMVIRDEDYCR